MSGSFWVTSHHFFSRLDGLFSPRKSSRTIATSPAARLRSPCTRASAPSSPVLWGVPLSARTFAGTPPHISCGGIFVPCNTSAPAATMDPSPTSQSSSSVAPMPMSAPSWIVQACTVTLSCFCGIVHMISFVTRNGLNYCAPETETPAIARGCSAGHGWG